MLNKIEKDKNSDLSYQSFPEGKDRGIDLLDNRSTPSKYCNIVQVKHQPNVSYSSLLQQLSRSTNSNKCELEKIKELHPKRYIIATSKSLTLQNREGIMKAMAPYILSLNDIIDREELNKLLRSFPEIETHHPKLWFSSTSVFKRILHNDIISRTNQLAFEIAQKIKLYVPVYSIDHALKILKHTRLLVLIGEPGCGKTTFAEMVLHKLAGMDFKLFWIDKAVSEVEHQLGDDDSKQAFYFDDFLGHTRYEIESSHTQEKGLLQFLRSIIRLPNKYFILTSRTSLFNSAAIESERFRNSGLFREKQEISIRELSISDKISIIVNHLDVKEVPNKYRDNLTIERLQEIAKHKNFSPRLIEFVSLRQNYEQTAPATYYDYIIDQLDNPNEVWLHAYEQQISDYDRFFLTALYSFGGAVKEQNLELAFEERLIYEIKHNNITRTTNTFRNSFKKLLGSFVTLKRYYEGYRVDFINPSMEDFLNFYLKNEEAEKLRMINSAHFLEQVYQRFRLSGGDFLTVTPGELFRRRINSMASENIGNLTKDPESYLALYKAFLHYMFFRDLQAEQSTLQFLEKVNWESVEGVNHYHLFSFLQFASKSAKLKSSITTNFNAIILAQFRLWASSENFDSIKYLFDDYGQDYNSFISVPENQAIIKGHIDFFFEDEIFNEIEDLHEHAIDIQEVADAREQLLEEIGSIYCIMKIDKPVDLQHFDEPKWESICATNKFKIEMQRDDEAGGPIRVDDDF
jgi:DNA polymerase III delta prime subunit